MKRQIGFIIKILVFAALLIAIAFLIKDSSDQFKGKGYSASAPTGVKFQTMKQWLPEDAEFLFVIDPHRLFVDESQRARIANWIEKGKSFAGMRARFFARIITNPGAIGLVATAFELTAGAKSAEGVLVVQGKLDVPKMLNDIQEQVANAGVTLFEGACGGIPLYVESSAPDAFALTFPDKNHILVGNREVLERIINCDAKTHGVAQQDITWYPKEENRPVFGRFLITSKLRRFMPGGLQGLKSLRMAMGSDLVLHAEVPCASTALAERAQTFFQGMRVSLLLASADRPALSSILMNMRMIPSRDSLRIAIPFMKTD